MNMSKALLNIEHNFQTITHPAQHFDAFSKTGYKVPKWYLWNVSGKQALKKTKKLNTRQKDHKDTINFPFTEAVILNGNRTILKKSNHIPKNTAVLRK